MLLFCVCPKCSTITLHSATSTPNQRDQQPKAFFTPFDSPVNQQHFETPSFLCAEDDNNNSGDNDSFTATPITNLAKDLQTVGNVSDNDPRESETSPGVTGNATSDSARKKSQSLSPVSSDKLFPAELDVSPLPQQAVKPSRMTNNNGIGIVFLVCLAQVYLENISII